MNYPETIPRSVIDAAFRPRNPVISLGRAAWLYLALLSAASDRGIVMRNRKHLAKTLQVSEATLEVWLSRFANAGLITITSPAPFLTIILRFWSHSATGERVEAGRSEFAKEEVPVSNSYSNSNALSSNAGDRGQGEGATLAKEVHSLLQDVETAEIERILSGYPEAVIRKTLDRVEKTPPGRIRKSKTALFRYLLTKFSEEIDVREL